MWNSYWKGETRSSESFNGVFSHFRLSDKFYDKSGHLERNVLGEFAITIQVLCFLSNFKFWTLHYFVVFASTMQPKQKWWRGAVVNVLMI